MLRKQNRVAVLEQRLERIDQDEPSKRALGCLRHDRNPQRKKLLKKLEKALADYDILVQNNHRMSSFASAPERDIESLQNWIDGNGCIAREDSAFLEKPWDLLSISNRKDNALTSLEPLVEDMMIRLHKKLGMFSRLPMTLDPNVFVFNPSVPQAIARFVIICLVVVLLLVPMSIINALNTFGFRLLAIVFASALFILAVSGLTKAKTVEVFMAGATYATVLVVFVGGNGKPIS